MEGGSNSTTSCLMSFGDNSNGLCSMMMMMPLMSSHHEHHDHDHQHHEQPHHLDADSNTLFLPLAAITHLNQNRKSFGGNSSLILDDTRNNNNNSGCYVMEGNDGSTSSTVKAKIMSHPHYHRLLAAYVNCQKVQDEILELPNT